MLSIRSLSGLNWLHTFEKHISFLASASETSNPPEVDTTSQLWSTEKLCKGYDAQSFTKFYCFYRICALVIQLDQGWGNLANLARDEILTARLNLARFWARDLRDLHHMKTTLIIQFSEKIYISNCCFCKFSFSFRYFLT